MIQVDDYTFPGGWANPAAAAGRARQNCEQLEKGEILFWPAVPFELPEADREFLLAQRQSDLQLHKNISYRPATDRLRGFASRDAAEVTRFQEMMRRFSTQTVQFGRQVLAPYSKLWQLDYATYRPQEEEGRQLSLYKRNDLLHVDSFPSRPTFGARILRVFTNIHPERPRVWITTDRFPGLLKTLGEGMDARKIVADALRTRNTRRVLSALQSLVGWRTPYRSPYDIFMYRLHGYMKENAVFQKQCPKERSEFPAMTTWMAFTDDVPHAVLSGQCALEQTFIVPMNAMVNPERAPIRLLEAYCGVKCSG